MLVVTTREGFEKLIDRRLAEASLLLTNGEWDGAYYIIGYAVEYAFKIVIIKNMIRSDCFPDKSISGAYYGHSLRDLRRVAGFETEMNAEAAILPYWLTVTNWSEQSRYQVGKTEAEAKVLFDAVVSEVLPWIKARW